MIHVYGVDWPKLFAIKSCLPAYSSIDKGKTIILDFLTNQATNRIFHLRAALKLAD